MRRTKGYYNGKPIYSLYVNKKNIIKPFGDPDFQAMFNNGEQGFFYNPNDLKTVSQDTLGTTAVTITGQPIGLLLDKSKGLSLLPHNLQPALSIGGTGVAEIRPDNTFYIMRGSTGNAGAINIPTSPNKWYKLVIEILSGNPISIRTGPGTNVLILQPAQGKFSLYVYMASFDYLRFVNTVDNQESVFKIHSLDELKGNHTYQTTSAARPLFKQKPILGNELVANGNFDNGTTGWTTNNATLNVVSGELEVTSTGSSSRAQQVLSLVTGKRYLFTVKLRRGTTPNSNQVRIGTSLGVSDVLAFNSTSNTYREIEFTANVSSAFLTIGYGETTAGQTSYWDNISVKEIIGYRTDQNYIEYDGVDDKLITNLPSTLTNCTVLRAIPNAGTQVKYNQTLPMLYEDSTNHAGLVAINRGLTRKEQLRLMEEFDRRAGAVGFDTTTFKMFDSTTQGFWYDPNDLNTMFQDSAGNVPVTAVGQPVGLILDKSKGLGLGLDIVVDGGFSDATKWTLSAGATISNGKLNVESSIGGLARQDFPVKQGGTYKVTLNVDSASGSDYTVRFLNGGTIVSSHTYTTGVGTKTWIITATSAFSSVVIQFGGGSGLTAVFDSISVVELKGNHAYQTTSASRPILRQNAVTGAYYLEFDGTDDFLQTNSINFTGTDKMSFFAGVRELRDTISIIAELSVNPSSINGVFSFLSQSSRLGMHYRGTVSAFQYSNVNPAPTSAVIASVAEIEPVLNTFRFNGSSTSSTATLGTGNFGNHPLYIGRRSGELFPFNGHIYSLICVGKIIPEAEVKIIEKEIAKRTGVTLNV